MSAVRVCGTCDKEMNIDLFEKTTSKSGGYRRECKACRSNRRKERVKSVQRDENPIVPTKHACLHCGRTVIDGATFTLRKDCVKTVFKGTCVECNRIWHEDHRVELIRKKAHSRNIYFDDSKMNEFKRLVEQPCHYCGYNEKKSGLNRLDSSKGYLIDNVVPSCIICNLMRGPVKYNVFLKNVQTIVEFNRDTIQKIIDMDHSYDIKTKFYLGYETKNDKTDMLTCIEKRDLKNKSCYLCGKTPSNGIDRFDSSMPYRLDNCRPCCKTCNMMKKDFSYDSFLYRCHVISTRAQQYE